MSRTDRKYSGKNYTPFDFDFNLCLKVPFWLGLSIAFLSRHILTPIAVFAIARKTGNTEMNYLLSEIGVAHIFASMPALLVLTAWFKRNPSSPVWVRHVWLNGRMLLIISAMADLSLRLVMTVNWWKPLAVAFVLLDIYVVIYIVISQRVRDVFTDFPEMKAESLTDDVRLGRRVGRQ